jgi:hypothetical protein
MSERRRSERYTAEQEIYARIKSSIPVRIIDVSQHGMRVESSSAVPPAGACDLWVPGDAGDVKLKVRVQRCRARFENGDENGGRGLVYQAGLEYLEMDALAEEALSSILKQLGGVLEEGHQIAATVRPPSDEDADESGFEISTAV